MQIVMNVEVYISHSYKAPRKTKGVYGYILVYHDPQGREATKTVFRKVEATPHEADLMAAVEALKALNRPCEVEIIGCDYLSSADKWLDRWRANGWKNAKGQEIAHKDLWQQYNGQIQRHRVKFGVSGSFSDWLETEIRKKKEKIGG